MQYVSTAGESPGCFLCTGVEGSDDRAAHILWRGDHVFVLLNAFPYNTGHLMVAPNRHVADVDELSAEERAELMEVTFRAKGIVADVMAPQGFNIGINLGSAAGAGVPGHVHVHVVPRWGGDTNFMTTVGVAKVLPEMLADTYDKLLPSFGGSG